MMETTIDHNLGPISRRLVPLVVVGAVLLLMAFYSVTDGSRLAHDFVLDGADYAGYSVCHRITERSFSIAGRQMPLCARCTGMYLGVSVAFVVLALAGRRRWSYLPPLRIILVLLGFIGLWAIDGINSYSHFFPNLPHAYEPRNWLRLLTGLGAGLTMGIILFPALAQTLWRDQIHRPAIANLRELLGLTLLALLVGALVLTEQPAILYVLGLASAAGVLTVLTAINTTAVLILSRRDAQASRLREALVPLAIGLVLAVLQIALISFIRFSATGTLTGFPGI
ncbi:MAG: DUF2085 domain-containing protein [Chloroflexota bacterium]|jgi:uncharacterized membrane protein